MNWQSAVDGWTTARNDLAGELRNYLLDGLPELPGLDALAAAVGWDSVEGLHGDLDLGPLHLTLESSALIVVSELSWIATRSSSELSWLNASLIATELSVTVTSSSEIDWKNSVSRSSIVISVRPWSTVARCAPSSAA